MKVYAINLKTRKDRQAHIVSQFKGRTEFTLEVVPAVEHEFGFIGLWQTMVQVIKINPEEEYIIFCQDDHQFTDDYKGGQLLECIENAKKFNAEILLGGVSWFDVGVKCSSDLYWVNRFTGAQFIILFRPIYSRILELDDLLKPGALDLRMCELTSAIFVIFPFISIQKEFGYSDVTRMNNHSGRVDYLFANASRRMSVIEKVNDFIRTIEE